MSSSNGTEYYLKSMNGIKVFDDGSGTVIEDDTITVATITCEKINADEFNTDTFNLEVLNTTSINSLTGNLTIDCNLTTTGTTYADTISSKTGATGTIQLIGDVLATKLKPDYIEVLNNISCLNCSADDTLNCITLQADYINISSLGNIKTSTIMSPFGSLNVDSDLTTTGTLYTDTISSITGLTPIKTVSLDSITPTSDFNFLANHTSNINIGKIGYNTYIKGNATASNLTTTGYLKTAIIQPPSLISQIEFYKDSALQIYFGKFNYFNYDIKATDNTQAINLFTDNTGQISLGSHYAYSGSNINGLSDGSTTYGIMNNITTANLRIGHAMVSGVVAIANNKSSGDINIMNNVPSSGSVNIGDNCNGAINLVRNSTTTGHVNIAKTFKIFRNNFEYFTSINPYFNFCNNLLSSNTMYMGGLGTTTIGNVFSFKSYDIVSSGINDTINLFNNITTGIVNCCYGLTSSGTLQLGVGKIRHGATNYYGYSRFLYTTTNATIQVPIDINYYVVVGGATATSITLPTYITNQLIVIRSTKSQVVNLTVNAASGQSIIGASGISASSYSFSRNITTSFFSNGSVWYVM